jgi:hypothetical protein
MNFQFSVNKKDYIKYLVLQPVVSGNAANGPAVENHLGTKNVISGVLRPQLPVRRIQITLG